MRLDMQVLYHQLWMFLCMMALGFAANKTGLLNAKAHDALSRFIMNIIIPALMLSTISGSDINENKLLMPQMVFGGFALFFMLLGVGYVSARVLGYAGEKRNVHMALMSLGSAGFFGIPLAGALLGDLGTIAFGMYFVVDGATMYTIGIRLSKRKGESHSQGLLPALKRLATPASIAVVTGFVVLLLRIPTDNVVFEAFERVGSCSTPLAMLCIGANIARSKPRQLLACWPCAFIVAIKMIAMPVGVWYLATALKLYQPAAIALTLVAALPSSTMFAIMCHNENNPEGEYATGASIIMACCTILTMPLVAMLCGW